MFKYWCKRNVVHTDSYSLVDNLPSVFHTSQSQITLFVFCLGTQHVEKNRGGTHDKPASPLIL